MSWALALAWEIGKVCYRPLVERGPLALADERVQDEEYKIIS